MLLDFHHNEQIVKGGNTSFVVLIPEKENPVGLSDYRPISLLGCMCKVLAKFFAKRLSMVMKSVISTNQIAFLKGRNFLDGVVVINEIIEFSKKGGKSCMTFKVDFEKAYDSVS